MSRRRSDMIAYDNKNVLYDSWGVGTIFYGEDDGRDLSDKLNDRPEGDDYKEVSLNPWERRREEATGDKH